MSIIALNASQGATKSFPVYDPLERKIELCLIISAIALPIIFSIVGILPPVIFHVACLSAIYFILLKILSASFATPEEDELNDSAKRILDYSPVTSCVLIPILEEAIFREGLQNGTRTFITHLLPKTATPFLGSFSIAALSAMLISGILFGLAHSRNHVDYQVVAASVSGVFALGPIYELYGLWASSLTHIMINTVGVTQLHSYANKSLQK